MTRERRATYKWILFSFLMFGLLAAFWLVFHMVPITQRDF